MVQIRIPFLVFFLLAFASCSALLGIKKIQKLDAKQIAAYAVRYHIPTEQSYMLDTTAYGSFVNGIHDSHLKKDVQQPLQVKVFDGNGKMLFWLVNCYIGGFPNLKWDRYGTFDVFPPVKGSFASVNTALTLGDNARFYFMETKESMRVLPMFKVNAYDLYIIVHWAHFLDRQSKRLVRLINNYQKRFSDKRIQVIYVNDDNWY
jgi:hypothetical protein